MATGGGWFDRLRLWFTFNEWAGATVVLIVSGLVIGALILAVLVPTGPTTEIAGRIEQFGNRFSKTGNKPQAVVRLATGDVVTIELPRRHICGKGDPVSVRQYRRGWLNIFSVKRVGCAA